jgi:hypothetical protein
MARSASADCLQLELKPDCDYKLRHGLWFGSQILTKTLQEGHEIISSLVLGLLLETKAKLAALSTSADLGEVGKELVSDLLSSIDKVQCIASSALHPLHFGLLRDISTVR